MDSEVLKGEREMEDRAYHSSDYMVVSMNRWTLKTPSDTIFLIMGTLKGYPNSWKRP